LKKNIKNKNKNTTRNMTSFKIYFSEDNIRRIRVEEVPSYEDFIALLHELYPKLHLEHSITIKYVDSDGDKISLDTQLEWDEMLMEFSGQSNIKLLVEGNRNSCNDGPMPEFEKFYDIYATPVDEWIEKLQHNVPEYLSSVFENSNIPSFLEDESFNIQDILGEDESFNIQDILDIKIPSLLGIRDFNHISEKDIQDILDIKIPSLFGFRDFNHMSEEAYFKNINDILQIFASVTDNQEVSEELIVPEPILIPEPVVVPEPILIPEPVVVPEPIAVLSDSILPLRDTFSVHLHHLTQMGFSADTDVLLLLLEQYNGNVDDVAQFLLGF